MKKWSAKTGFELKSLKILKLDTIIKKKAFFRTVQKMFCFILLSEKKTNKEWKGKSEERWLIYKYFKNIQNTKRQIRKIKTKGKETKRE